jgi:hypothetical protein
MARKSDNIKAFYLNKTGKSLLFNHVLTKTHFRKNMTLWGWLLKHLLTIQAFTVDIPFLSEQYGEDFNGFFYNSVTKVVEVFS